MELRSHALQAEALLLGVVIFYLDLLRSRDYPAVHPKDYVLDVLWGGAIKEDRSN